MFFDKDSPMVQNCLLLLNEGLMTRETIPDFLNLKEVVINEYDKSNEVLVHNELEDFEGGEK